MNGITHKVLYLFCLGFLGCTGGKKDLSGSTLREADIVNVKLKELDDQPLDLTQFKGKTVFIKTFDLRHRNPLSLKAQSSAFMYS